MLVQVEHTDNIVDRAADEVIPSVVEAQLGNVLVVALREAAYGLLQLLNVPPENVCVSACADEILVRGHRVERLIAVPSSRRLDLSDTLMRSSVPYLHDTILCSSQKYVD